MSQDQIRQEVLMYVRDEIIDPIVPPVKRWNDELQSWIKTRDFALVDALAAKHTDKLIELFKAGVLNATDKEVPDAS